MRSLFKSLLRLARDSSGTAMIEMTIVVPVAISLMAGGVDFAMGFSTYATGSKSVRDAARYLGSLRTSECSTATTAAQNLAVYGNLAGTGSPLLPGWGPTSAGWGGANNNVNITCGSTIIVTAKFPYTSLILATFLPIASTYTLGTQHEEPQVGGS